MLDRKVVAAGFIRGKKLTPEAVTMAKRREGKD